MRHWIIAHAFVLTLISNTSAIAEDHLVIISPHRKSIQSEYIPAFKEFYKKTYKTEVVVDWLDQGGTSDDIKFVKAKFEKNPQTSGIDLFWGGGPSTFLDLNKMGLLSAYPLNPTLSKEIPMTVAGVPFYDASKTWYAAAVSSFGIFYNKKILGMDKKPEPKTWQDLANPAYFGAISVTDPRHSGSANTMNAIILQSLGWDKAWELFSALGANTRQFTHSSSDPIKSVVAGDASIALTVDFYALPKIDELGKDNLGFVLPNKQTVLDPDPIAILKGAPNSKIAERFVDFVLSTDGQKLLILPKGQADGPKLATLGRMAINSKAYTDTEGRRFGDLNPFKMQDGFINFDTDKAAKSKAIFNDLMGAVIIDNHKDLQAAWQNIQKKGASPASIAEFSKPPITEKEFYEMAAKWDNEIFRNQKINEWVQATKAKLQKIAH